MAMVSQELKLHTKNHVCRTLAHPPIAFNNGIILDEGTPSLNRPIPTSGASGSVSVYLGAL